MRRHLKRSWPTALTVHLALALALAAMSACNGSTDSPPANVAGEDAGATAPDAGTGGADTATPGEDAGGPVNPVTPMVSPEQKAFAEQYAKVLQAASTMTLEAFTKTYTPPDAPAPVQLGYDALKAAYFDDVDKALAFTPAEKSKLSEQGFMVSGRLHFDTMAQALLHVYQKDLPVLVTSDMILQALHESYDDILKTLETAVLVGTIDDVLAGTSAELKQVDVGAAAAGKVARADADFYIAVARSLLKGSAVASQAGGAVDADVQAMLKHIEGLQMKKVTLFGKQRVMDFSQFKPRGHYEGDAVLERYFRAMMWLGRADLRFVEFDAMANTWRYNPRQIMAAMVLRAATHDSGGMVGWQQADDLIGLMVGPVDYMDFKALAKLEQDHGWTTASDVDSLDKAAQDQLVAVLISGQYGAQKIASHYLLTDPLSAETTPLPPSFAFLGQRFVVDSHVFSNVVYDRVIFNNKKVLRAMPDPLDALFVLGNDQVLPLLESELKQYPYQGSLHALRYLVDSYTDPFWQGNVYNLWLHALRALNKPTTGANYPKAMTGTAWRDKTAHTQLASWAQLRHDTLLYAKQSYTGSVGCEHPDGFVEPVPELYKRLQLLAQVAGQTLVNAPFKDKGFKSHLEKFFANWEEKMGTLAAIADKELAGTDLSADDVDFLKKTIMADPGCGVPVFSGWYTSLYFSSERVDKWRPTIADVHTNPNTQGPMAPPRVLHVGTSNVELMVLTADRCQGAAAYVGPVMRYHNHVVQGVKRLADSEWEKMLTDGKASPQPAWTASYRVPK